MKRLISILLALCILCSGCAAGEIPQRKQYTATFLNLFDTVTTIVGQAESEAEFHAIAQSVHDDLLKYHQLFDIYNNYDGINNLKTINDQAGIAPVQVDANILHLLQDCKDYAEFTGGMVNVAMGSVLKLWHDARTDAIDDPAHARPPEETALLEAAAHMDPNVLIIDEQASTVFLSDPAARLDVGAVAKGWATQRVAEQAPVGILISVGGNVCATGPKDDNGTPWVVGIQNPDGGDAYLHTIYVSGGSVVTSGDYQRTFVADGKAYHHIIDPRTLYPSGEWRAVTVVCPDSGLADALSTALFLLPLSEGNALLEQCGAEALWVGTDGTLHYSDGFQNLIRT